MAEPKLAIISRSILQAIGDAIRTKRKTTEKIPTVDMASEILAISTGVDPAAVATRADQVLSGVDFIEGGTGNVKQGSIQRKETQTYTPTTVDQVILSGQYLDGHQIVKGDANLVPEAICNGWSIFGVNGVGAAPKLSKGITSTTTINGDSTVAIPEELFANMRAVVALYLKIRGSASSYYYTCGCYLSTSMVDGIAGIPLTGVATYVSSGNDVATTESISLTYVPGSAKYAITFGGISLNYGTYDVYVWGY